MIGGTRPSLNIVSDNFLAGLFEDGIDEFNVRLVRLRTYQTNGLQTPGTALPLATNGYRVQACC